MTWIEIKKRMRDNNLSYAWLVDMLYRWYGIVTTENALRSAVCKDSNHDLRNSVGAVLTRYERICNGKD